MNIYIVTLTQNYEHLTPRVFSCKDSDHVANAKMIRDIIYNEQNEEDYPDITHVNSIILATPHDGINGNLSELKRHFIHI